MFFKRTGPMSAVVRVPQADHAAKLLEFFAAQPPCLVAMEACGGAHHWAREISKFGHEVRLIPPAYVKPFVKRQKNDAADAEAICEAAQRPTMRFVAVKSEEQQAAGWSSARATSWCGSALRSSMRCAAILPSMAGSSPKGPAMSRCWSLIEKTKCPILPEEARAILRADVRPARGAGRADRGLDNEIARRTREDEVARRLMTIPGIGPITATAIAALAPPAETFGKGRDFAAWLGLTPLQKSTGGKQKLGATSKMGERTLRRLLIIGAARSSARRAARGAGGLVAGTHAGAQAAHAGHRRAGQQDGAHRLGAVGQSGDYRAPVAATA